ncbi:M28 family peptidase [candidate division WOR-3 bacterium]|nr:M28 family peptidase [candidate division WOR-3 bacterium]
MLNALKILKELDFERIAGSDGEEKARNILCGILDDLGVNQEIEEFELSSFETGKAEITTDRGVVKAHPFGLTKSCELEGELVFVENSATIALAKNRFKDKVVLSKTYSRGVAEELKKSGVIAFVLIGGVHREATSLSYRQKTYKEGPVPCFTVTYEDGAKLSKQAGNKIVLKVEQIVAEKKAKNIVATIKGKGLDDNLTYAVGHYDTVSRSPGGTDNGGGTVTLLKIAEYFSKNTPGRDLKIIWFSGEELGLLGSYNYVKSHLEEIKDRAALVVNIDVTGDDVGEDYYNVLGTKELLGYADGVTREMGFLFKSSLEIYSSDCMPFSVYEIPSVNVFRSGGISSFHIHTQNDSVKNVTGRGLQTTIDASINFLNRVLNASLYPVKREIDKSLKEKIEKYIWNSTMEEPKLQWRPEYKK